MTYFKVPQLLFSKSSMLSNFYFLLQNFLRKPGDVLFHLYILSVNLFLRYMDKPTLTFIVTTSKRGRLFERQF